MNRLTVSFGYDKHAVLLDGAYKERFFLIISMSNGSVFDFSRAGVSASSKLT